MEWILLYLTKSVSVTMQGMFMSTEPDLTKTAGQMKTQCSMKGVIEKIVYKQGWLIRRQGQWQEEGGAADWAAVWAEGSG